MANVRLDWTDIEAGACSVTRTVDLLGDRWSVLVLRDVFNGVYRFDDIAGHLGISRSVLSAGSPGWSTPACWSGVRIASRGTGSATSTD